MSNHFQKWVFIGERVNEDWSEYKTGYGSVIYR